MATDDLRARMMRRPQAPAGKPLTAFKTLGALGGRNSKPSQAPSTLGEPEGDTPEEIALTDHQKMMKQLREQQKAAIEAANDAGYWFAVYFQNSQQKDEFIAALKLSTGGQYVDGLDMAAKLGITLTPRETPYKTGVLDKKCAALARKHGEE